MRSQREPAGLLETILESQPHLVILALDSEYRYLAFNENHARTMKAIWNADIELGACMLDYITRDDDRARAKRNFDRALAGEHFVLHEQYGNEAHSRRSYDDAYAPLHDDVGEVAGLSVFLSDITEQERASTELAAYRDRLESLVEERTTELANASSRLLHTQKLESLGLMAGGVAHDFNNLLVGILGFAELALDVLPDASPARRYVDRIHRTAEQAATLTHQLLAYAGRTAVETHPVDINEVVNDVEGLIRVTTPANVAVSYELRWPIPLVRGDATQLQQVLINLVTNAAEAVGDEAGHVVVRSSASDLTAAQLASTWVGEALPAGPYVVIEVEDDGIGMDDETRTRLFDPFFTTKFQGRGLGLASVLGIVRGHRGAITVRSSPNDGSLFRVLLPAYTPTVTDPDTLDDPESLDGEADTALIIDDEDVVRDVTAAYMAALGYRVLTAPDGLEGLRMYDELQTRVRIVLLDLTMPKLSGERTFALLRERRSDLPVLVISGYVKEHQRLRFLAESKHVGFLHKPFDRARLADAVHALDPD